MLPVNDGRLFAINAETGKLCETFANKGILNLQTNMPDTTPGLYAVSALIANRRPSFTGSIMRRGQSAMTSGLALSARASW